MSNPLVNWMSEGSPLFSSGRERLTKDQHLSQNQGHHAKGRMGDDIARAEMMEITRWENEGGRIVVAGAAHQPIGTARKSRQDAWCSLSTQP